MRALLLVLCCLPLCAAASPEATVAGLWRALSHGPGQSADVAALGRLFHEKAVIFGGTEKNGMRMTPAADFIKSQAGVSAQGFYECETVRDMKVYDRFAVAYSVVETRTEKGAAAPAFVGVNSVQLYKDGAQWRILALYYQLEKPGVPLQGGPSGQCLPDQ
jgi:hypothetical protein